MCNMAQPAWGSDQLHGTEDVASPMIRELIQRTPRPVLEEPFELSTLAAVEERLVAGR